MSINTDRYKIKFYWINKNRILFVFKNTNFKFFANYNDLGIFHLKIARIITEFFLWDIQEHVRLLKITVTKRGKATVFFEYKFCLIFIVEGNDTCNRFHLQGSSMYSED